jgi:hypothetical protein
MSLSDAGASRLGGRLALPIADAPPGATICAQPVDPLESATRSTVCVQTVAPRRGERYAAVMSREHQIVGRERAAYIAVAVIALPAFLLYDRLFDTHPRIALVIGLAVRAVFVALVGYLAWLCWSAVRRQHRRRRRPAVSFSQPAGRAAMAAAACLFTIGAIGGIYDIVREIVERCR